MHYDQRGRLITKRMKITSTGGSSPLPTLPVYQEQLSYNNANQPTTTQTTIDGQPGYTFTQAYESTTGTLIGLSNTSTGTANVVALTYNERALISDVIFKDSAGALLATKHLLYDGNLRPASSTTTWQGSSTIYSDGVSFDAIGNVLSRVTTHATVEGISGSGGSETQNFCYDELNQLVWASNHTAAVPGTGEHCGNATLQAQLGGSYTNRYLYTHLGQLWQGPLSGTGVQQQYLYCQSGKPHQVTNVSPLSGNPTCGIPGTTQYNASYDDWGNLTTRTYNGQIGTLNFDALDHLTEWKAFASTKAEQYLYNAAGERVLRRSNDGTATKLVVYAFGLEEHQYLEGGGGTITPSNDTYYYSIGGMSIGMLSGPSAASQSVTFPLADLLGSVVASFSNTPGSAAVLGNQLYDPYGNQRYQQGIIGTQKGYTGQYADSLTGLDYYHARYYDPVVARFISADTKEDNFHGFDPYAYVQGNPETKNDPTGHAGEPQDTCGGNPVCYAQSDAGKGNNEFAEMATFLGVVGGVAGLLSVLVEALAGAAAASVAMAWAAPIISGVAAFLLTISASTLILAGTAGIVAARFGYKGTDYSPDMWKRPELDKFEREVDDVINIGKLSATILGWAVGGLTGLVKGAVGWILGKQLFPILNMIAGITSFYDSFLTGNRMNERARHWIRSMKRRMGHIK